MKTLLFTLEYPPFRGGVANYYGRLVKFWPEADRIAVLDNCDSRLINPKLPFLKWLPSLGALRQAVSRHSIDLVLAGQLLPLGAAAFMLSYFFKFDYAVILHGMDLTLATSGGRKKILARAILKRAKKIICSNSYTSKLAEEFLGQAFKSEIITVNPGAEPRPAVQASAADELKTKYGLNDKIILLSVGRLVKRKGFDMVIKALPEALKQGSNLTYVILGAGEEAGHFTSLVSTFHLDGKVTIIENAADRERDAWYEACDVFIMPSRRIGADFEGFGLVYLEANLAGKPVIAGRSGGVADAVADGVNGLLVDPENVEEIAGAIVKLSTDSNLRQILGRQGRERALKEFNWPKQIKKICDFIKA